MDLRKMLTLMVFTLWLIFIMSIYNAKAFTPKLDMQVNWWTGVNAIDLELTHEFHIKAKGELDFLAITSCHRYIAMTDASNVTKTIFKIKRKNEYKFTFTPSIVERSGYCPLWLHSFEKDSNRHSRGLILFKRKNYKLVARVFCDGKSFTNTGVAGCNAKIGTIQALKFEEPVTYTSKCLNYKKKFWDFTKKSKQYVKLQVVKDGVCAYIFKGNKSKKLFRFVIISHDGVKI